MCVDPRNFSLVELDRWNLVCHGAEVGAKKIVFYRVSGTKCVETRFFRSEGCPNYLKDAVKRLADFVLSISTPWFTNNRK